MSLFHVHLANTAVFTVDLDVDFADACRVISACNMANPSKSLVGRWGQYNTEDEFYQRRGYQPPLMVEATFGTGSVVAVTSPYRGED